MSFTPGDSLIVALDFPELEPCRKLIHELRGLVRRYKVGSELFTAHGWQAVELVHQAGGEVFLDLKLHDIPTTVAKTARVIAGRGVWMFNVHALGGLEMMRAARKSVDEVLSKRKPLIVAVTVLTSHEESMLSQELGISKPLEEEVLSLAQLSQRAGLDGVVSSPRETRRLRRELGKPFVLVTPGIRPPGSPADDQQQSLTPSEAIECGASYLVVGRPITASQNPVKATKEILDSL